MFIHFRGGYCLIVLLICLTNSFNCIFNMISVKRYDEKKLLYLSAFRFHGNGGYLVIYGTRQDGGLAVTFIRVVQMQ